MPDASSSRVGADGTAEPGVKARMVAPPARVPASASSTVNGVTAPAAGISRVLEPKSAKPARKESNRNLLKFIFSGEPGGGQASFWLTAPFHTIQCREADARSCRIAIIHDTGELSIELAPGKFAGKR